MSILEHFPKEINSPPRDQQIEALNFIENAFNDNKKVVILEAPVGSGKSAVAMAASRYYGGGIVAMPTISLQAQYLKDFKNTSPLLGRARFPCQKIDLQALKCIPLIKKGIIPNKPDIDFSCARAPCLNKPRAKQKAIKDFCDGNGGCPHQISLDVAQESETVISNLHSLIYSVSLNSKISKRSILILDECHDLQKFMRGFLQVKFKIRRRVLNSEIQHLKTNEQWFEWLKLPEQLNLLKTTELKDSYMERLEKLEGIGKTVFKTWNDDKDGNLWVELTPINIGAACKSLLFSLADKIILMSGTIYNKETFLKPLGMEPNKAAFLRIDSDFPVENRLVVLPRNKNLNLTHKFWEQNIPQAIKSIQEILNHHSEQKGLIQTSSYRMTEDLINRLNSPRIISHNNLNFATKLLEFQESSEPKVFISPVISQGVDFKEDLARWQILIRPKFDAINDPYTKYLLDNNRWDLYNLSASIVLGQQIGRVVRSNTDKGVTYLLSSTFLKFISKINHLLPLWQKKAFIK